jgi:hypothetical protein
LPEAEFGVYGGCGAEAPGSGVVGCGTVSASLRCDGWPSRIGSVAPVVDEDAPALSPRVLSTASRASDSDGVVGSSG